MAPIEPGSEKGLREYLVNECVSDTHNSCREWGVVWHYFSLSPREASAWMQSPVALSAQAGGSPGPRRAEWLCLPVQSLMLPILA